MILFANPSTRPRKPKAAPATKARKRTVKKGASAMAKKHRSAAQKAATRRMLAANRARKRHHNPSHSPRKAARQYVRHAAPARRRRVHRNPSFAHGILGELASMDGLILLGSAAAAPTVVDFIAAKVVPTQYSTGWTGLLAKAAIAAAGVYALDRWGKQRKAAIGFAAGSLGSLLAQTYRTFMVNQALPAAVTQASPATGDEIARNPTLYAALMNGNNYASMNGYDVAPMAGYEAAPMLDAYESLN